MLQVSIILTDKITVPVVFNMINRVMKFSYYFTGCGIMSRYKNITTYSEEPVFFFCYSPFSSSSCSAVLIIILCSCIFCYLFYVPLILVPGLLLVLILSSPLFKKNNIQTNELTK